MNGLDWMETHVESVIDLRECSRGDILISRHGAILVYMGPTKETDYMDHVVEYIHIPYGARLHPQTMGAGTRTHDGYVFRKNRLEEDHDVVKVLKKGTDERLLVINSEQHILRNYITTI